MDRLSTTSRNAIHNVAAHLPVVASINGSHFKMRAEEIGVFRMLIKSKQAVRPLDKIEIMCGIDPDDEPVYATVQAQYVEKTWSAYYIDAAILKLRPQDCARWERFVARTAASVPAAAQSGEFELSGWRTRPHLVTLGGSLPMAVRNELRQLGILVHHANSTARALALLARRPDILVADSSLHPVDIRSLCEQVSGREGAPDLMFIVEYASEAELESFLSAGATRIVLKPSNQHMLVHRIKAALIERAELQTAAFSSARTLTPVEQAEQRLRPESSSSAPPATRFWASLRWQLRGFMPQALRGSTI